MKHDQNRISDTIVASLKACGVGRPIFCITYYSGSIEAKDTGPP